MAFRAWIEKENDLSFSEAWVICKGLAQTRMRYYYTPQEVFGDWSDDADDQLEDTENTSG